MALTWGIVHQHSIFDMDPFLLKDDMYQKRAVANNLRDQIKAMGCYMITVGKMQAE